MSKIWGTDQSHRQVSEPDKCSPDCAIHLYRFSRVWRCDDAVQPADECDPSSHSCSGDCDFPSWELDSGFPITVVSDLRIEAGDITNDVDDRIWMVSTELGECSGSPGLCWDNDDCPGAETCDTDAGVVRVRYTDEDCACDSASNCAFDNTDVVLANDLPTDASTSWDDLAAIDANSHYTRVFWSNQETERFMYSEIYNIGTEDPVNDWTTPEVAEAESDIADDHLFVIPDAPQYTFMAVVKTSKTGSTDTLTQLMARSPSTSSCSGGTCSYWGKSCSVEADCDPQWFYHEIAQESSDHTRPSAWYNSLYGCLRYFAVDRDNDESEDFDIVEKHVAINSLTDIFDCGSNSVCVSSGNPCACCNGEGSGSCSGLSWSSQTTLIDRAHKLNDPAPMFWYPPDLDWPDGIGWPADWMVLTADNDFVCDSNNDCEAEDKPCDCCTGENTGNCAGSPDDDTGEYRHWRQRLIPFPPSTTTTTTIPTCSTTSTTTTTTTSTTL